MVFGPYRRPCVDEGKAAAGRILAIRASTVSMSSINTYERALLTQRV